VQQTHGLFRPGDDILLFRGQHVDQEHPFEDLLGGRLASFLFKESVP